MLSRSVVRTYNCEVQNWALLIISFVLWYPNCTFHRIRLWKPRFPPSRLALLGNIKPKAITVGEANMARELKMLKFQVVKIRGKHLGGGEASKPRRLQRLRRLQLAFTRFLQPLNILNYSSNNFTSWFVWGLGVTVLSFSLSLFSVLYIHSFFFLCSQIENSGKEIFFLFRTRV